ncbi:MAG: hypothetical protein HFG75_12575 [Hungatella sp.]|nr:hypothetical protein [Hungatella sp.]
MEEKIDAKDGSRLLMRIWRGSHSVQGMGIWGDRAFVLHDTGICGVHDLRGKQKEPLCVFPLGSWNEGTPSKDYRNHANSCMFSDIHCEGNPIPLLYVTVGTGTGFDRDGYFYRCAVESICCSRDSEGKESYTARTVQTITYHPDGIEKTDFLPPCWGCPAFLIDSEERALYIFSAKYRTKRECVPEGEKNTYIITRFALPDVRQGGFVRLTPEDILDQFTVDSEVMFTQGGTIADGRLYYTFGCPHAGYPLHILIFDLNQQCLWAHITDLDAALEQEEPECCAFYEGTLLVNTNAGDHGSIFRVPEGRPRLKPDPIKDQDKAGGYKAGH